MFPSGSIPRSLPVGEGNILTVLEEDVGYHSNLGIHLEKELCDWRLSQCKRLNDGGERKMKETKNPPQTRIKSHLFSICRKYC